MYPSGVNVGSDAGVAAGVEVSLDVRIGNVAGIGAGGFTSVGVLVVAEVVLSLPHLHTVTMSTDANTVARTVKHSIESSNYRSSCFF